jgi:malate dehydrogenase (quinone)
LLLNSGIPEGKGFGGFPVSGQWLRCKNEELIKRHQAKVYGKAGVGAPPMSVPHLDTRVIDGKKGLLFGPYAGFSTKFLKTGSLLDLPLSLRPSNIFPMMAAGLANMGLTKYLIGQVLQSQDDRIRSLKEFVPHAVSKDWELLIAGQRVQVIKYDAKKIGILQFGTEVVVSADGSISALLGASPGASIAVSVMVDLIKRCFKESFASAEWQSKIKLMIPSYGIDLAKNVRLYEEQRARTNEILYLNEKA